MAMISVAFNSFATGEISESLSARYDLDKFKPACRRVENSIVELHGDVRRRSGTYALEDLGGDAVLLPFSFSSDPAQNICMVFTDKLVRFATLGGFIRSGGVPVSLVTTYALADLMGLSYAQSGDVVYIAHPNYALQKISRFSNTSWTLSTVSVNPKITTPGTPSCSFESGPTEEGQVIPDADYTLRYRVAAVASNGEVSLGSTAGSCSARHPTDWILGDKVTVSWSAVTGAEKYFIFREEGGYFGLVGVSESTSFIDIKYAAETSNTPRDENNPFADGNNPGLVTFYQQRLYLGGAAKTPQTLYGSQTANFENFSKSYPVQDDDPVEFMIASGLIDALTWMAPFGDLLIGTGGAEYKATGGADKGITPSTIQIKQQSYWGSTKLKPLIIGNSILHVQRQGAQVRDLYYSLEKDGYAGNNLTVLAPHLFEGLYIKQWTYQQSPGSVVWAVRSDGVLLGLTYLKEHNVWAWHRHTTQGEFRSVCAMPGALEDSLYLVVKRTINGSTKYFLESMEPKWTADDGIENAFFVDCGLSYYGTPITTVTGLSHLEGKAVAVLADGSPVEGLTVASGQITLPYAANTVHVGLPFSSILSPMPPEMDTKTGSTLGRVRSVGVSKVRLLETVGGKNGPDLDNLQDFPFLPEEYDGPVEPYSGDLEFSPGGGMDSQYGVWIVQDRPLPMTIIALMLEVDIEG